MNSVIKKIMN